MEDQIDVNGWNLREMKPDSHSVRHWHYFYIFRYYLNIIVMNLLAESLYKYYCTFFSKMFWYVDTVSWSKIRMTWLFHELIWIVNVTQSRTFIGMWLVTCSILRWEVVITHLVIKRILNNKAFVITLLFITEV